MVFIWILVCFWNLRRRSVGCGVPWEFEVSVSWAAANFDPWHRQYSLLLLQIQSSTGTNTFCNWDKSRVVCGVSELEFWHLKLSFWAAGIGGDLTLPIITFVKVNSEIFSNWSFWFPWYLRHVPLLRSLCLQATKSFGFNLWWDASKGQNCKNHRMEPCMPRKHFGLNL